MKPRSVEERVRAVRRVLDAGRKVFRDRASLTAALSRSTGLARENIELGFTEHWEIDASEDDVRALVQGVEPASSVGVVLSAHVFVAPLRALALAVAASENVVVRPSSREPAVATALVRALDDPGVVIDTRGDWQLVSHGKLVVYGSDETIAHARANAPRGVAVEGHGTGFGVAIVGPKERLEQGAQALARDIVVFDQRGCLSPRVAICVGDETRLAAFGHVLADALAASAISRGRLHEDERAQRSRFSLTMRASGALIERPTAAVALQEEGALAPGPTGRFVVCARADDTSDALAKLAPLAPWITTIGITPCVADALLTRPPFSHTRLAPLGKMQKPPLDGPVDQRAAASSR